MGNRHDRPIWLPRGEPFHDIGGRQLREHGKLPDGAHDAQLKSSGVERLHEKRKREAIGGGHPDRSKAAGQDVASHRAHEFALRNRSCGVA